MTMVMAPQATPKWSWRRCRILMVLCLGGLATSIAIAWGCALGVQLQGAPGESLSCLWHPPGSAIECRLSTERFARFGSARYDCAIVAREAHWPDARPLVSADEVRRFVPGWSRHILLDWVDRQHDLPPGPFVVQGVDARGWPFAALWCAYAWNPDTEPDLWYWAPHGGGIRLGDGLMPTEDADWWPRAALPCLPIWAGLAGDTAFYAVAWWLLLAIPVRFRSRCRRRRGQCSACAYPIGASSVCTECGARVQARSWSHPEDRK